MKKLILFSAITLASISTIFSCTKEFAENNVTNLSDTVLLSISAVSPETRTVFGDKSDGGYPITWAESGEAIEMVEVLTPSEGDVNANNYKSTSYSLSEGNSKAIFSVEIPALTTKGTYDYHALYPQSAFKSANTQYNDLYAIIPDTQTPPSSSSPDASATILYASSTGHTAQPTESLNMTFKHVTAYGRMTITGAADAFASEKEKITSVSISVPAGGIYYYWSDGHITSVSATAKDAVTVKTDNLDTSGDFVAWFACAPYTLAIGEELSVAITTDANTYTRVIKMTKAMNFESGKVSKFTVDMSDAGAAEDLSGDYLIASTDGTNPWYLMTYEVSSNVFLGASTSVSASTTLNASTLSDFCSSPYVWTLAKVSGGYTLKNAYSGEYATVKTDNNYGQSSSTPVTLTVANDGDGVFSVAAQNFPSRNLQFNYNSGNTRFAFYGSSQKPLHFIKISSYKVVLDRPTISASASGSTVTVSWGAVDNASSYSISCGELTKTISDGSLSTDFTDLDDGTYPVTVIANGTGNYSSSLPASATVVVSSVAGTEVSFVVGTDFSSLKDINDGVTKEGIKLTCNTTAYYSPLRIYTGNTVKFEADSGKKIAKVVLTASTNDYIRTWTASDNGNCIISGSTMTWTNSGASSVTFTQTHSSQARIKSFTVTYISNVSLP